MNRSILITIMIMCGILVGCHQGVMFDATSTVPDSGWDTDQVVNFDVGVEDTTGQYNLYLQVRNSSQYAYSNLWLFVRTYSPSGATIMDTVECQLATPAGKWLGRGVGNKFAIEIPYKNHIQFPVSGTYRFEVQHGMRDNNLTNLTEIGLRIEKSE